MKIYIAGKITGDKNYKAKFTRVAHKFRTTDTIITPSVLPERGMSKADYMRICFAMIDSADKVAFIQDWRDSPGATVEHGYCRYIGKPIIYL